MDLATILQMVFAGLTIGSVYALVALGYTLIYNVTGVVNFAQGEFLAIGALTMISLTVGLKLPLVLGFVVAVALAACLGVLFERLAIRKVMGQSAITAMVVTFGAAIFARGGAALVWGKDPLQLPAFSGNVPLRLMGATLAPQALWAMASIVVTLVALWFFLDRTMFGKAMRACAANRDASYLMGIDVQGMVRLSFVVSAALGALGGIVITPMTFMSYQGGTLIGLKGFVAVVVGGTGSIPGAVIGGLLLGMLEATASGFISSEYRDAIAFSALFLVLFLRPRGLLGGTE